MNYLLELVSNDDYEKIKYIETLPNGDETIVIWLKLLFKSKMKCKNGVLKFYLSKKTHLSNNLLNLLFNCKDMNFHLKILEENGLIIRNFNEIIMLQFWKNNGRDRSTPEYREWRFKVMKRDSFICVNCGSKEKLQAHHKIRWVENESLRFDIDNGITLCYLCHRKEHGKINGR